MSLTGVIDVSLNQLRGRTPCEAGSTAALLCSAAAESTRIVLTRVRSRGARKVQVWASDLTLIAHPVAAHDDEPAPTTATPAPQSLSVFLQLCAVTPVGQGSPSDAVVVGTAADLIERASTGSDLDELLIVALPDTAPVSWTAIAAMGPVVRWGSTDGEHVELSRSSIIDLTTHLLDLLG